MGTSLAVQWLRLPSIIENVGSTLFEELRYHMSCGQNIKQKQYCNKFNKDFKINKECNTELLLKI